MFVTNDIRYIGVNDHKVDLFEGQYVVPNGISYNSYLIRDEKYAVMDTVDGHFGAEWLSTIVEVLGSHMPDYLVIQHMEPDHAANIETFMRVFKDTVIVSTEKAFEIMKKYFGTCFEDRRIVVKEGDTLNLGRHTLAFVEAPMVHWPEVMVSYDLADKVLFSADGFGKFGALDIEESWADEARRYFIGIVGQYGSYVQDLLKKVVDLNLDIKVICPLHGPVLKENLGYYIDLYDKWSSYTPEAEGIVVAYTSVYGHTEQVALNLAEKFRAKKCPNVIVYDLARDDMSKAVSDAFKYNKLVLATTTYNGGIYPFMHDFINRLVEHRFQNRTIGFIENGSWAPKAASIMRQMFTESQKIEFVKNTVCINAAMAPINLAETEAMANEMCREYLAHDDETANKNDLNALFNVSSGVYVVTTREGIKDVGCIVNSVTQLTNAPNRVAVTINKANHTHDVIKHMYRMNINCLSVDAPFKILERFGFRSSKNINKFDDCGVDKLRSRNGMVYLSKYINSFMSLKVESYTDLDTHGVFICSIEEARVINERPSMTYGYYQSNVKPKPETKNIKGHVCKVCGYIYESNEMPADFVCPLCKHGIEDFEKIGS